MYTLIHVGPQPAPRSLHNCHGTLKRSDRSGFKLGQHFRGSVQTTRGPDWGGNNRSSHGHDNLPLQESGTAGPVIGPNESTVAGHSEDLSRSESKLAQHTGILSLTRGPHGPGRWGSAAGARRAVEAGWRRTAGEPWRHHGPHTLLAHTFQASDKSP
jgi:hypothetical protein